MKGAILDVFLVSAEGLKQTNIIGTPTYYVIVECGRQLRRSKTSGGNDDKVYWNEKFSFELPPLELEKLSHLKLRILDEECFLDGGFVGEARIFLKGIIAERNYEGITELSPAAYNVVLEDGTYEGQINIGLRFNPNAVLQAEKKKYVQAESVGKSILKTIARVWPLKLWSSLFSKWKTNPKDKDK